MTETMPSQGIPAHGPRYEPIGAWWTFDAPSLRVPDPAHEYVSIWSTGNDGPCVLLVHRVGADHRFWEPLLPNLVGDFTVSALDVRSEPAGAAPDAEGIRTAARAVGANLFVAQGNAAEAVMVGAPRGTRVVLWDPPADVLERWSAQDRQLDVVSADDAVLSIAEVVGARPYRLASTSAAASIVAEVLRDRAGVTATSQPEEGINE
ncbi:MAG: hypothetical protein EOO27_22905 [Comamonadaceae bacterium]|nr:MAG: hypothetical protein EOO27_22905 [Comamonadaceae bacterium]